MQELVDAQLGSLRILMRLLAFFSSVTLGLILVGIYGLTSYSVGQRIRELGIRRALGARDSNIVGMIMMQALRIALAGIGAGLLGALAGARVISSYLFHTSPMDPIALFAVFGLFVAVMVAAGLTPALRAAQVDPASALRYE
jgi:ABC-type antimicrobial peptide transport system permease subunit